MTSYSQIHGEIKRLANQQKAKDLQWFFKTGKGQYGEGDQFLGLVVPVCRKIAKQFYDLPIVDIEKLLKSQFHEERLIGLLILVAQYKKGDGKTKETITHFYLSHTDRINNWDLVDLSCREIVGASCVTQNDWSLLRELVKSRSLWERRIAIISTHGFIRNKDYEPTFAIAKELLADKEDLMHKAVGWMLREVEVHGGKEILLPFLKTHYSYIPRTTLRYAIEHFPEPERKKILKGGLWMISKC